MSCSIIDVTLLLVLLLPRFHIVKLTGAGPLSIRPTSQTVHEVTISSVCAASLSRLFVSLLLGHAHLFTHLTTRNIDFLGKQKKMGDNGSLVDYDVRVPSDWSRDQKNFDHIFDIDYFHAKIVTYMAF